jgi:hypothetical protein
MSNEEPGNQISNLDSLAKAAESAGIEFSPQEGAAWVTAVAAEKADPGEIDIDQVDGIGGFDLALLDFDPASAARLRGIGEVIATRSRSHFRSGLAIAGSAAQGRIQPFPADNDFFERWHITAPTIEQARTILANHLREDVIHLLDHPALILDDVCFGSRHGLPLRWKQDAILNGSLEFAESDGSVITIEWQEAAADPGFTKIAWVLIDAELGEPGMASKVIDATWKDAEGVIHSLDGLIDGEFQQVYLDPTGAELAAEVTRSVSEAARVRYITDLESQVASYSRGDKPNFAKVAKRLYNICRITGRHNEALFLRELFDEPPARLIQLDSRLWIAHRKAEFDPNGALEDLKAALSECDGLVMVEEVSVLYIEDGNVAHEAIANSIASLSTAISAVVTTEFERRLRSYEPILALLEEIADRYSAAT